MPNLPRKRKRRKPSTGRGTRVSDRGKSGTSEDSLDGRILACLGRPGCPPLDLAAFLRRLRLAEVDKEQLEGVLARLEKEGRVARIRGDRYVAPAAADLLAGLIQFTERGNAFVIDESAKGRDLHIAGENTGTALHGDRVLARVTHEGIEQIRPRGGRRRTTGEGPSGRVVRILHRARETIVGTLQRSRQFHYVVGDDPRFVHNIYVHPDKPLGVGPDGPPRLPKVDDKVVVRLFPWESRHVNPEGEIIEILGRADDPRVDVPSIIRKFNLPDSFPPEALREAETVPSEVLPADLEGREDHREMPVFTVDPDDARDFDDAIFVERLAEGWRLYVHIADVSHYVPPGGALDREALRRGNSVYLVDRVIPMLPERLSNGICSLRPHEDRLSHAAVMEFDRDGRPGRVRFTRGVIRSVARLTYPEAFAVLKRKPRNDIERRLHQAWELASVLRAKRMREGSLDLDFPEIKVRVDETGRPVSLEKVENDISHQLVEECMLAANEAVARVLRDRHIPAIYRVHEDPDPEKLREYRELAAVYGLPAGDLTKREELRRLLDRMRGMNEEHVLKVALLKSLRRAAYSHSPDGHYGLAKSNYTHFTSPIRRYADLVVHRALLRVHAANPPKIVATRDLPAVAAWISATERTAAEAETDSVRLKQMEFFAMKAGRDEAFEAVIIDVRNYGFLVELPETLISGLVHVSSLSKDFFRFDPARIALVGQRTRRQYRLGDRIRVRVEAVDLFKRQVDFRPV